LGGGAGGGAISTKCTGSAEVDSGCVVGVGVLVRIATSAACSRITAAAAVNRALIPWALGRLRAVACEFRSSNASPTTDTTGASLLRRSGSHPGESAAAQEPESRWYDRHSRMRCVARVRRRGCRDWLPSAPIAPNRRRNLARPTSAGPRLRSPLHVAGDAY